MLNCSYRFMSALVVLPQFCDTGELVVNALLAADPQPVDTSALQQITTEVPPHSAVHLCSNIAHHKLFVCFFQCVNTVWEQIVCVGVRAMGCVWGCMWVWVFAVIGE